jgi:4'-phosphopantetheinyl transferase
MKTLPVTDPLPLWCPPPATLELGRNEVHVWCATLDQAPSRVARLFHTLATDEKERAEGFCFQKDREHFIVARALLRAILGRYLEINPDQLRFYYSSTGKPALPSEYGGDALRFNLSHSHGVALYAFTRGREVGIDIERVRPDMADGQIAERFFSAREVAMLRALPVNKQTQAFFNCWTRKEAYIKALGQGLSLPLNQFDVSLAPGEPARLLGTRWHPQEASRWCLQELTPAPGYTAAMAVEGQGWRLEYWECPE